VTIGLVTSVTVWFGYPVFLVTSDWTFKHQSEFDVSDTTTKGVDAWHCLAASSLAHFASIACLWPEVWVLPNESIKLSQCCQ
jgi:hypothetical protein